MSQNNKSKFLKLSNAGIQMGLVIGLFAYGGKYLDEKQMNETPVWTVVLSLLGVAIGLYLIIKEVININKTNEKNDTGKERE